MSKIPLTHVNIIKMLGLESLAPEVRQEIVMSAVELVETRVLARILDTLDETSREGFERLLHDTEDAKAVATFMQSHGVDYWKITEEEIERVKQEMLSLTKDD